LSRFKISQFILDTGSGRLAPTSGFFKAWAGNLNNIYRIKKGEVELSYFPLVHYSMPPASGYPLSGFLPRIS